jgi:hypothetical protein
MGTIHEAQDGQVVVIDEVAQAKINPHLGRGFFQKKKASLVNIKFIHSFTLLLK